jgi:glucokinase
MILAGDIGGTKTHLALFDVLDGLHLVRDEKYPSHDFENLSQILHIFLRGEKKSFTKACFGVAGPIKEGRCQATNLAWVIDIKDLSKDLGNENIWLLNDLEANAYGINCLTPDKFFALNEGQPYPEGNAALISAGTGLGEAGMYWDGKIYQPISTEGGHVDFGPRNELEVDLWRYLKEIYGHVSYERVVSGMGIYNLYRFLVDSGLEQESDKVKEEFKKKDPPKVITEKGVKKECKVCSRVLEWFVSLYGSEAGNLALKYLALGGVYVGGGIAPKITAAMKENDFMGSFVKKGRFAPLLATIPVKIVLNENTALLGAAHYAKEKKAN